jgi:hypothetical protein
MEEYRSNGGANFEEVRKATRIIYNPAEINRHGNKYNIDFDPGCEENDDCDIFFFNSLINDELVLRKLPIFGTLVERRSRLLPYLMMEQRLALIEAAVSRTHEGKEAALMLIKQAIPCIMHLENRGGEKVITYVICLGAERYQKERNIVTLDGYVEQIKLVVQRQILGSDRRPKQWKFPLKDNGKEVNIALRRV